MIWRGDNNCLLLFLPLGVSFQFFSSSLSTVVSVYSPASPVLFALRHITLVTSTVIALFWQLPASQIINCDHAYIINFHATKDYKCITGTSVSKTPKSTFAYLSLSGFILIPFAAAAAARYMDSVSPSSLAAVAAKSERQYRGSKSLGLRSLDGIS